MTTKVGHKFMNIFYPRCNAKYFIIWYKNVSINIIIQLFQSFPESEVIFLLVFIPPSLIFRRRNFNLAEKLFSRKRNGVNPLNPFSITPNHRWTDLVLLLIFYYIRYTPTAKIHSATVKLGRPPLGFLAYRNSCWLNSTNYLVHGSV